MIRKRLAMGLGAGTALTTALLLAVPAAAQSSDVDSKIEALQAQIDSLKADQQKAAAAKSSGSDLKIKWGAAPTLSSADGRFEMKLRGRLFVDTAWLDDDFDRQSVRSAKFRLARLGVQGKVWNNVKYGFEIDFAGDKVSIKDATLAYDLGFGSVQAGNFKTFNSLEELTSDTYTTFMERPTGNAAFGITRQLGVAAIFGGDNWSASFGGFRGGVSDTADDQGTTLATRVTFGPKIGDNGRVHLGASYRYRDKGADQANFGYSTIPFSSFGQKYVNTSGFAKKDNLIGLELATVFGPFSAQGEYMWLKADRAVPAAGFGNPTFTSWYGDVSYFLTGESRNYDGKNGVFGRVKVKDPVFEGGFGAWQLTARYDRLDLNDENILGGEQKTWVLGVNWFLNDYTRLMANYSQAKITDGVVSLTGPDRDNKVKTFGLRAQVDW